MRRLLSLLFTAAALLGCTGLLDRPIDTENMVMVIVAARDLYPGVTITEDDLFAVEIPPQLLPNGVYLHPDHVVGRIPRQRILRNEFVRARRLADPETGVGLQAVVPDGMRALAIPGGGAVVSAGAYVDVWREGDGPCALLQAAFVLAVNGSVRREPVPTETLTVLVAPASVAPVLRAASTGGVRVAVRADDDVADKPELACSP